MSRDYHVWTPAEDRLFLRTLARHTKTPEALIDFSSLVGRMVTRSAADARCASLRIGTVYQQLNKSEADVDALLLRLYPRNTDPAPPPPSVRYTGADTSDLADDDESNAPTIANGDPPSAIGGQPVSGPSVVIVRDEPSAPHIPAAPPAPKPEDLHPLERREREDARARERREFETIVNELRDYKRRQEFLDAVRRPHPTPHLIATEKTSGLREMVPVVTASDWHIEEEVDPVSIANVNAYNLEIAARRIDNFFRDIVWMVLHNRASKKVVIRALILWLGGDLITGYIHEELVETNLLSPTEAILWLLPRLVAGIRYLLDELALEHLELPCSHGNHGRTTPKRRISSGYANSFEWLMYSQLASMFTGDPRVHFEITASEHQYVRLFDFRLHFHHGVEVNYQGGVGGIGIPLLKAVAQWDTIVRSNWHFIGHWHQLRDYDRALVNGSLIGYNAYAQSIKASFEKPRQGIYFIDSREGKCITAPLWVARGESYAVPGEAA